MQRSPDPVTHTSGGTSPDTEQLVRAFASMTLIRRFEEEVQNQFTKGTVLGTTHLCIGQEAVCAGVSGGLRPDDVLATTYRGHGHLLARGADPAAMAAELLGRATGLNGGRSGSMNIADFARGVIGSFSIVGGSVAAATGAGLSLRDTGRIAVATFGDGCVNQGYFFECLNFASVFELPVLFVCENNLYGEYTPWEEVTAGADILARAQALGVSAVAVDGMDVGEVLAATRPASERIRNGGGPELLECLTYRFVGHSRSDPATYRKAGELDQWRERDPLVLARGRLIAQGTPTHLVEQVELEASDVVSQAFTKALGDPYPVVVVED